MIECAGVFAAATLVFSATPSWAQSPPPEQRPEEVIVITGSRIPRPNLTAVSPITVVNSQEVKLEGAVLTETLINALPQVSPDQGSFISNGASGTSTVNLRGLDSKRTLVLINGRRLLPGDSQTPSPDINFIPSSLIKRVEVLTGGASSVYGSDAVAGVTNFILDTRLEGLRVDAQSSFYQHDNRNHSGIRSLLTDAGFSFPTGNAVDGAIEDINGAYGLGLAGGRAHLTAYAGYRKLSALAQNSRDYSACTVNADSSDGPLACGGSGVSAEGTFATQLRGRFRATADRTFVSPSTLFNFAPYNFYQRPGRRITAGAFMDADFGQAFQPYAELMFMNDRTVAQIAPSGDFGSTGSLNCDSPLLSAQQLSLVCTNGNFVGQTPVFDRSGTLVSIQGTPRVFTDPVTGSTYLRGVLRIGRRNVEGGPRQEILTHRDWRVVGGAKGRIADGLTYDADYLKGSVEQKDVHTNDLLITRFTNALDVITNPATGLPACRSALTGADTSCVPWDVFALGAVTPEAAASLAVPSLLEGSVRQQVATATLTADLDSWGVHSPLAARGPAINIGGEYRKDRLIVDPDEHYQNADLAGSGVPILPLDGSTSVRELFAEARLPIIAKHLIEELTVEAGYRRSWYKNAGHRFTASSSKLGAEVSPVRGIRFRASLQRAVRAPNIQELFAPVQPSFILTDPCAGLAPAATFEQCARTGVTASQYGQIIANPFEDTFGDSAIVGGNSDLLPENAKTLTLGVVFQPRFLPGFNATADWFDIKLKNAIAEIGGDLILNTCLQTGDPRFCSRVHRDAEGTLWETPEAFVDDRNANVGSFRTNGLDVGASYTRRIGRLGTASIELNGTWTHRFSTAPGGLAPSFDCAGAFGQVCNFPLPRWRHNLRGSWEFNNGAGLSLLWRHVSPLSADAELAEQLFGVVYNPATLKVPAQDYFDLTALYRFKGGYALRVGVRNLLDREPPIVPGGAVGTCGGGIRCNGNTYPQLYDPLGRYVFVGVTLNLKP